jgi:hypothetical protein
MNSMINYCSNKGLKTFQSFLKSYSVLIFTVLLSLTVLWSCEEDPTKIGGELLPDGDFATMVSTDTLRIKAYTMYTDSVKSTDSLYFLGSRYSPWFGTTKADFVTQLNLLKEWKEDPFIIDSVSLILSIATFEGDTISDDIWLEMYEISEYLNRDAAYYSNKPVQIESLLGTFHLAGAKADTVLEIRLPSSIAAHLLRDTSKLFISSTEPDFRQFFKGVYFTLVDRPTHSFFSLRTGASTSGIQIYYHTDSVANATYSFVLSDKSAKYKRISHDFSTAEPDKRANHVNDMVLDTLAYQQSYFGLYTRLEIPGLAQFRNMLPASVNKARLTIPVLTNDDGLTDNTMPQILLMRYTNAEGRKVAIPDMYLGESYYGGYYSADKDRYAFNLASFVQEYLEGRISEPVVELYMPVTINRDAIFRVNGATVKPKLELSLTKF